LRLLSPRSLLRRLDFDLERFRESFFLCVSLDFDLDRLRDSFLRSRDDFERLRRRELQKQTKLFFFFNYALRVLVSVDFILYSVLQFTLRFKRFKIRKFQDANKQKSKLLGLSSTKRISQTWQRSYKMF